MTDRAVRVVFAVVALAAGGGVIALTHDRLAHQAQRRAALHAGLGFVREPNARAILAEIGRRSPPGARLQNLTLKPDDMIAVVEDPATGSDQTFGIDSDGHVKTLGSSDAASDNGVAIDRVDPAMFARLAREVLARVGQPETALAEVDFNGGPKGSTTWVVELQHTPVRDRQWIADGPTGNHLHRNG